MPPKKDKDPKGKGKESDSPSPPSDILPADQPIEKALGTCINQQGHVVFYYLLIETCDLSLMSEIAQELILSRTIPITEERRGIEFLKGTNNAVAFRDTSVGARIDGHLLTVELSYGQRCDVAVMYKNVPGHDRKKSSKDAPMPENTMEFASYLVRLASGIGFITLGPTQSPSSQQEVIPNVHLADMIPFIERRSPYVAALKELLSNKLAYLQYISTIPEKAPTRVKTEMVPTTSFEASLSERPAKSELEKIQLALQKAHDLSPKTLEANVDIIHLLKEVEAELVKIYPSSSSQSATSGSSIPSTTQSSKQSTGKSKDKKAQVQSNMLSSKEIADRCIASTLNTIMASILVECIPKLQAAKALFGPPKTADTSAKKPNSPQDPIIMKFVQEFGKIETALKNFKFVSNANFLEQWQAFDEIMKDYGFLIDPAAYNGLKNFCNTLTITGRMRKDITAREILNELREALHHTLIPTAMANTLPGIDHSPHLFASKPWTITMTHRLNTEASLERRKHMRDHPADRKDMLTVKTCVYLSGKDDALDDSIKSKIAELKKCIERDRTPAEVYRMLEKLSEGFKNVRLASPHILLSYADFQPEFADALNGTIMRIITDKNYHTAFVPTLTKEGWVGILLIFDRAPQHLQVLYYDTSNDIILDDIQEVIDSCIKIIPNKRITTTYITLPVQEAKILKTGESMAAFYRSALETIEKHGCNCSDKFMSELDTNFGKKLEVINTASAFLVEVHELNPSASEGFFVSMLAGRSFQRKLHTAKFDSKTSMNSRIDAPKPTYHQPITIKVRTAEPPKAYDSSSTFIHSSTASTSKTDQTKEQKSSTSNDANDKGSDYFTNLLEALKKALKNQPNQEAEDIEEDIEEDVDMSQYTMHMVDLVHHFAPFVSGIAALPIQVDGINLEPESHETSFNEMATLISTLPVGGNAYFIVYLPEDVTHEKTHYVHLHAHNNGPGAIEILIADSLPNHQHTHTIIETHLQHLISAHIDPVIPNGGQQDENTPNACGFFALTYSSFTHLYDSHPELHSQDLAHWLSSGSIPQLMSQHTQLMIQYTQEQDLTLPQLLQQLNTILDNAVSSSIPIVVSSSSASSSITTHSTNEHSHPLATPDASMNPIIPVGLLEFLNIF